MFADTQRRGKNLIGTIAWRLIFIILPCWLVLNFGPRLIATSYFGHLSKLEHLVAETSLLTVGVLAVVGLFVPRYIIRPVLGFTLFFVVSYELREFSYHGPMHSLMKEGISISAALAGSYLVLFDLLRVLASAVDVTSNFIFPKKAPDWAGEFANTAEKGEALELHVCALYKKIYGNAITTTEMKRKGLIPNGPGDQGADVIVVLPSGRKLAIQCKNYSSPIGNSAVQEIMTAKAYYGAHELAIISPNGYTNPCVDLARSQSEYYQTKLELIDSKRLAELGRIAERIAA
jgi:hypothetical protein